MTESYCDFNISLPGTWSGQNMKKGRKNLVLGMGYLRRTGSLDDEIRAACFFARFGPVFYSVMKYPAKEIRKISSTVLKVRTVIL